MNGVHFMFDAQLDQGWNVQVRLDRLARTTDLVGFVGFEPMEGVAVLVGVNRNRSDPQFRRATKYSDSNFTSVGNKKLFDRFHGTRPSD